jgi:hypothetical protein
MGEQMSGERVNEYAKDTLKEKRESDGMPEDIRPKFQEELNRLKKFVGNFIEENPDDVDGSKRTKCVREIFLFFNLALPKNEFPACQSEAENKELLRYIEELEAKNVRLDGDSYSDPYGVVAALYKDGMGRNEILRLFNERKKVLYVGGILKSGGAEILGLQGMENDRIVDFGKQLLIDILKDQYEDGPAFEARKTHVSYLIWEPLAKCLKLDDMSFRDIIEFGLKCNESHLWRELITRREKSQEDMERLSRDERNDIAMRIAEAYMPLIRSNALNGNDIDSVREFGGPVLNVIDQFMTDGRDTR